MCYISDMKKDRRGFLKLLGIGAGAAVAMIAARLTQTPTPAPAPRTIQDIEKPVRPYIGPDGPGGDYIKERPPIVPFNPPIVDPRVWSDFPSLQLLEDYPFEPIITTTDSYDHSLGGYLATTSDAWTADAVLDEFVGL